MQLLASCVTTTAIFTYICFSSWYYINITTILNFPGPIKPWKKIYNNALQLLMWRNMFMDHAAGFQIVCQYNKKTTCVFLFVLAMHFLIHIPHTAKMYKSEQGTLNHKLTYITTLLNHIWFICTLSGNDQSLHHVSCMKYKLYKLFAHHDSFSFCKKHESKLCTHIIHMFICLTYTW